MSITASTTAELAGGAYTTAELAGGAYIHSGES
jgi:hypothetical protein